MASLDLVVLQVLLKKQEMFLLIFFIYKFQAGAGFLNDSGAAEFFGVDRKTIDRYLKKLESIKILNVLIIYNSKSKQIGRRKYIEFNHDAIQLLDLYDQYIGGIKKIVNNFIITKQEKNIFDRLINLNN